MMSQGENERMRNQKSVEGMFCKTSGFSLLLQPANDNALFILFMGRCEGKKKGRIKEYFSSIKLCFPREYQLKVGSFVVL